MWGEETEENKTVRGRRYGDKKIENFSRFTCYSKTGKSCGRKKEIRCFLTESNIQLLKANSQAVVVVCGTCDVCRCVVRNGGNGMTVNTKASNNVKKTARDNVKAAKTDRTITVTKEQAKYVADFKVTIHIINYFILYIYYY